MTSLDDDDITILGEVVASWDARSPDYFRWPHRDEAEHWALDHGIIGFGPDKPKGRTYRVVLFVLDGPVARRYQYATDEIGRVMLDGDRQKLAEPVDMLLSELPPEHLKALF
jgi:hypothetical protein